jgi:hypothetical protein
LKEKELLVMKPATTANPKLVAQLGQWELFPGTAVIGSKELDRYIRVPSPAAPVILRAAQYMDGSRSPAQIDELLAESGARVDLPALCRRLKDAGLIEGAPYRSDLDRVALTWASFSLWSGPLENEAAIAAWRRVFAAATVMAAVVTVASLLAIVFFRPPEELISSPPAAWSTLVPALAAFFLSLAIHEGAHGLAALSAGLAPTRVRILGYFGVIPYIVLTISGMYTVTPRSRLRIWLAGPVASLVLGLAALGLACPPSPELLRVWLIRVGIGNLLVASWNVCPLVPSDGYFIASTIMRQTNWRLRSWRELVSCIRQRRRPQLVLFLYGWVSLLALLGLALQSMQRILRATNYSWIGYVAVTALLGALAWESLIPPSRRRRTAEEPSC